MFFKFHNIYASFLIYKLYNYRKIGSFFFKEKDFFFKKKKTKEIPILSPVQHVELKQ